MKNLTSIIGVLSLVLFSSVNVNAQCGATDVTADPQPEMICEGNSTIITFTPSGACAGNYEYEVLAGATVVQAWSTTSTFNAAPLTTTVYTVNLRCNGCPAIVVWANFTVEGIEEPTVNGILSICPGEFTTLTASASTGNLSWWNAANGGAQLSPTDVYTTPALSTDATYYVTATGSFGGGGGSILITECGLDGAIGGTGSEDYIEISNLYTTPVNTTGWTVAVSSSYTNINSSNATTWSLPASFPACSVVTRTDANGTGNYWGNNIFWNSTSNSWAIIIDDSGNVVDFIAWGWTAAQLATFNPTINGFSVNLGAEWVGNGCPLPCGSTGGVQYSFARTGSADNNVAGDFVCQPTSVDLVNPGLSCGWIVGVSCPYPVDVLVSGTADATIAPAGPYCALDLPVNLSAVDAGGTWSGTGITNVVSGTFNPATAGAGLNTITYEIAGGCGDLQTYDILVHATPIVNFVADNIVGCAPVDVTFTNLSTPLGSSNVWSFGNLDSSWMTTGPTTTYNTPDCFDVTLTVTQNGCTNSLTIQSLVCVQDVPDAGFLVNSVGADIFDPEFIFSNTSTNADTYFWDFGDDESSSLEDPIHMYPQVASGYDVCLIASNSIDESCADTICVPITVDELLIYYLPNTFTPDGDSYNEYFQPIFTSGYDPYDFNMFIYNRWGEIIWESHDSTVGWDGTYGGGQKIAQDGTYTWKIDFKTSKNDERVMSTGSVNIIR
jgi:gliding motility-associated-like protein